MRPQKLPFYDLDVCLYIRGLSTKNDRFNLPRPSIQREVELIPLDNFVFHFHELVFVPICPEKSPTRPVSCRAHELLSKAGWKIHIIMA